MISGLSIVRTLTAHEWQRHWEKFQGRRTFELGLCRVDKSSPGRGGPQLPMHGLCFRTLSNGKTSVEFQAKAPYFISWCLHGGLLGKESGSSPSLQAVSLELADDLIKCGSHDLAELQR